MGISSQDGLESSDGLGGLGRGLLGFKPTKALMVQGEGQFDSRDPALCSLAWALQVMGMLLYVGAVWCQGWKQALPLAHRACGRPHLSPCSWSWSMGFRHQGCSQHPCSQLMLVQQ